MRETAERKGCLTIQAKSLVVCQVHHNSILIWTGQAVLPSWKLPASEERATGAQQEGKRPGSPDRAASAPVPILHRLNVPSVSDYRECPHLLTHPKLCQEAVSLQRPAAETTSGDSGKALGLRGFKPSPPRFLALGKVSNLSEYKILCHGQSGLITNIPCGKTQRTELYKFSGSVSRDQIALLLL